MRCARARTSSRYSSAWRRARGSSSTMRVAACSKCVAAFSTRDLIHTTPSPYQIALSYISKFLLEGNVRGRHRLHDRAAVAGHCQDLARADDEILAARLVGHPHGAFGRTDAHALGVVQRDDLAGLEGDDGAFEDQVHGGLLVHSRDACKNGITRSP